MNQTNPTPVKQCEFCEKVLHGRSDQRFCNDSCRNTFNRNLRMAEKAEHHKNIPEIIRIIKRNYEILKPMTKTITYIDEYKYYDNLEEFLKTGINPNFFTSTFTDKHGTTWNCVFDCGFCIADNGAMVGFFPNQANI
jgi:predicted nucleic acid-binding Zn ribbon protein